MLQTRSKGLKGWLKKYYLWLLLVGIALGLLALGYWLTRPADQTAIKYTPLKPLNVITGPPQAPFNKPIAMAVGLNGELFVVDSGNQRIAVISEDGRFMMAFGGPGSGRAELVTPRSIAVAPSGQVYVADPGKGAVLVFDGLGSYLYTIADQSKTSFKPVSLKADRNGNIFVFDEVTSKFRVYDQMGKLKEDFPKGDGPGLKNIQALDFDPEKNITYGVEANQPQYLKIEGQQILKQGDRKLVDPKGVIYNRSYQLVFVSDAFYHKVLVFNDGRYLGEFGGKGNDMNSFLNPTGMAFDEKGKLYIADTDNNRIIIYSY